MRDKNKFKNHEKKWQLISKLWKEVSKPGRPSKGDVENFVKLLKIALKDKISPKIVVLGATPEIRDCLYQFSKKLKAQIICVDMTKDMYFAMSSLVRNKNKNEKFINANWLKLSDKLGKDKVDAVIGDYVIGNLGGFEDKFLSEIAKILKSGGAFITRTQIMDGIRPGDAHMMLVRICKDVEKKKINIIEASSYFANNLILWGWFRNKKNKISLAYFSDEEFKNLDKKIKNVGTSTEKKVLGQFYKSWYLWKDKYWVNYKRDHLEKIIKKHFIVKKTIYSHDYNIAKQSPIYLLSR